MPTTTRCPAPPTAPILMGRLNDDDDDDGTVAFLLLRRTRATCAGVGAARTETFIAMALSVTFPYGRTCATHARLSRPYEFARQEKKKNQKKKLNDDGWRAFAMRGKKCGSQSPTSAAAREREQECESDET